MKNRKRKKEKIIIIQSIEKIVQVKLYYLFARREVDRSQLFNS